MTASSAKPADDKARTPLAQFVSCDRRRGNFYVTIAVPVSWNSDMVLNRVNSHEALVKALERCRHDLFDAANALSEAGNGGSAMFFHHRANEAQAALSRARDGQQCVAK